MPISIAFTSNALLGHGSEKEFTEFFGVGVTYSIPSMSKNSALPGRWGLVLAMISMHDIYHYLNTTNCIFRDAN